MKLLDCTLRDGGYYNNWDFDRDLVDQYLKAMVASKVDMVELGLRNFSSPEFKGAHFFTTDAFIQSLDLPSGTRYGVMVDAKTILSSAHSEGEAVNKLFSESSASEIEFVRVACHFSEVEAAEPIVRALDTLGYRVILNLMQISQQPESNIVKAASQVASWGVVESLYFADSLGNMTSVEIAETIQFLRQAWTGPLGIHTHNNMGYAVANSLAAIELGTEYIDATVSGMGRGAGNAETEILLAQLPAKYLADYDFIPVAELSYTRFTPLKEVFGWGMNLHYTIAAKLDVHPTYVQTILTDPHYGHEERVGALSLLQHLKGRTSFVSEALHSILQATDTHTVYELGGAKLADLDVSTGREVLLLANGESIRRHEVALAQYIERNQPIVFALNNISGALESVVDYRFYVNNGKALSQSVSTDGVRSGVVIPMNRFSSLDLEKLDTHRVYNFAMHVDPGVFDVSSSECTVPNNLSLSYALAALSRLSLNEVLLAGFDGYAVLDDRQKEVEETLRLYAAYEGAPVLTSLTPTSYLIKERSVYAPDM